MKLTASDISFRYRQDRWLWEHVSFTVHAGEIFTILGANGAGKSTLLRTLIGFLLPFSGEVILEDHGVVYGARLAPEFTKQIGYVPQIQKNSYSFTVRDYVVMGRSPYLSLFERPDKEDYALTDAVLNDMGIYALKEQPFYTLSGGQQRQAVIARAIVQQPKIIIMDEPTNHLDYGNQFRILTMIERLADQGIAILLTTHMPDQALYLGGRTGILIQNKFIEGPANEIITESVLEAVYQIPIHLLYLEKFQRKICIAG